MRLAAALTIMLLLTGPLPAFAADPSDNVSNKITLSIEGAYDASSQTAAGQQARVDSPTLAQDFAVFGLIGLGVIGLLWIRRHTSEL